MRAEHPSKSIATLKFKRDHATCLLADATADPAFGALLLQALFQRRHFPGKRSHLRATTTPAFRKLQPKDGAFPSATIMPVEQRNTMLRFGDRFALKFIRRLSPGISPDYEIGRLLTEKGFPHCAPVAGALELHTDKGELMTIAVLQGYVTHQEDAWNCALSHLRGFFEFVRLRRGGETPPALPPASPAALIELSPPPEALDRSATFLSSRGGWAGARRRCMPAWPRSRTGPNSSRNPCRNSTCAACINPCARWPAGPFPFCVGNSTDCPRMRGDLQPTFWDGNPRSTSVSKCSSTAISP